MEQRAGGGTDDSGPLVRGDPTTWSPVSPRRRGFVASGRRRLRPGCEDEVVTLGPAEAMTNQRCRGVASGARVTIDGEPELCRLCGAADGAVHLIRFYAVVSATERREYLVCEGCLTQIEREHGPVGAGE